MRATSNPPQPVTVVCDGDSEVYPSLDSAVKSIEALDVAVTELYDAEGRQYPVIRKGGQVAVGPGAETTDPGLLKEIHLRYFRAIAHDEEHWRERAEASTTLDDLLLLRQQFDDQFNRRHLFHRPH